MVLGRVISPTQVLSSLGTEMGIFPIQTTGSEQESVNVNFLFSSLGINDILLYAMCYSALNSCLISHLISQLGVMPQEERGPVLFV